MNVFKRPGPRSAASSARQSSFASPSHRHIYHGISIKLRFITCPIEKERMIERLLADIHMDMMRYYEQIIPLEPNVQIDMSIYLPLTPLRRT